MTHEISTKPFNAAMPVTIKSDFEPKLGYDGCGINNYSDPYKARIATMVNDMRGTGIGEKLVHRYTVHNELLEALKCALADLEGAKQCFKQACMADHDWEAHDLSIEEAVSAIAKAEGK